MSRVSYLAKNTAYLTIGQFGTKILSFLLVPLYTRVLSTVDYGIFDYVQSTVSLLIPLLTINICDSALRFSIDNENDKSQIFTISIYHFVLSMLLSIILLTANYVFNLLPIIKDYTFVFLLMFACQAINGIMNCFARGIDKMKEVAISGVLCSAVMMTLNIIFLIPLKMGLMGFFYAYIIGMLVQVLYLCYVTKIKDYMSLEISDKKLHTEMKQYCKPMVLNSISWWINNTSSRYAIVWLCGLSANGIFSVSYKIPSILTMFQGIFNQSWTISAAQEYDSEDKSGFFSKLYNTYNMSMILICAILIALSKAIATVLYANDFFEAWKFAPFLLIATVFGALSGYLGGIFSAVKDSKVFAQTTMIGAIINIVATVVLVYSYGVIGAAIASVLSYFAIWFFRLIKIRDYIKLKINIKRDSLSYCILIMQSISLLIFDGKIQLGIQIAFVMILVFINKEAITYIYYKIREIFKKYLMVR